MTPSTMVVVALVIITISYAGRCSTDPFGPCRKCRGFGFKVTTNRRGRLTRGRHCRRCDATGLRLRVGRRVFNVVQRLCRQGGQ